MAKRRGNSEGSIYQRKSDGKWCAALSLPGAKRKVFYAKTRREVDKKLSAARLAAERGEIVAGPRQTVRQFAVRWLEDTIRPSVRPRTFEAYEERLRLHVLPELGSLTLEKLSPQHLQRLYARKVESGLSASTVSHVHFVANRMLKQALRWNLVPRNVAQLVDPPRRKTAEHRPLDIKEIATFRASVRGHRYEPFWNLLLSAGLRFGEAAALRWSDVDADGGILHVRHSLTRERGGKWSLTEPKTAKSRRMLPLTSLGLESLQRARVIGMELRLLGGERWEHNDLVFPTRNGTPVREAHVLAEFHKELKEAGLARRRMHDLRHTFATQLFALNKHPRAVQDLLGHAHVNTTLDIYTGSVSEIMADAISDLDRTIRLADDLAG